MGLPIPSYFDATIGHLFKVTLRRRGTSSQWDCVLCKVKIEDGNTPPTLSFSKVWNEVCNENRIQLGCRVAFLYIGFGKFNFQVFGRKGFPRVIPFHLKDDEEDVLAQLRGPRGRVPGWRGNGGHADEAAAYLAISTHEKFISDTNANFQDIHYMSIPNSFVKNCLPYQHKEIVRCTIQDCNGKEWPMLIKFNTREGRDGAKVLSNYMLHSGLKDFVEHRLPKNTILTFEILSHDEPLMFRVKAFLKCA